MILPAIPWQFLWRVLRGRCWGCNRPRRAANARSVAGTRWHRWPDRHACRDCNKTITHALNHHMSYARAAEQLERGDAVRWRDDGQVEKSR